MSVRVVKRRFPNMLSVGDLVEQDGERLRVVEMRPEFFLVAPPGRKNLAFGTMPIFWRELV